MDSFKAELKDSEFQKFSKLIYEHCGINLTPSKKDLLKTRLQKRLFKLGIKNYSDYYNYVIGDSTKAEFTELINAVSTNKTEFFREIRHFEFLQELLKNNLSKQNEIYIWSAACSTGEEPYSIAMIVSEYFSDKIDRDVKILATDIDTNVLSRAQLGEYTNDQLANVAPKFLNKYFTTPNGNGKRAIVSNLKKMIHFKYLNLINAFPFAKQFDIIFCRNVMIYFDTQTQQSIVERMRARLKNEGYLCIGHSESLNRLNVDLKYIAPAIYQRL